MKENELEINKKLNKTRKNVKQLKQLTAGNPEMQNLVNKLQESLR
jgi:hypothetical protein